MKLTLQITKPFIYPAHKYVKMLSIGGILTFMKWINSMLIQVSYVSSVEHEDSFITWRPGCANMCHFQTTKAKFNLGIYSFGCAAFIALIDNIIFTFPLFKLSELVSLCCWTGISG